MFYNDIVDCIKINQVRQNINTRTLAKRLSVSESTLTEIRGYRMKVSQSLFEKLIQELSITDLTELEKEDLLKRQDVAKKNRHRRYLKSLNEKS